MPAEHEIPEHQPSRDPEYAQAMAEIEEAARKLLADKERLKREYGVDIDNQEARIREFRRRVGLD